jgi:tetratricopeptide (TPR) repeat protein
MQNRQRYNAVKADRAGAPYFGGHHVHLVLIILLCVAAYSNTFSVPFQFDDPYNITSEPLVRARSFMKLLAMTRGVGHFTFALNYGLHGADVAGYHVVNLIVHVLNALLVYGLVVLSFRTPVLQRSSLRHRAGTIAFFSALLFAVHPVQTEAVTYIVQRFASLAALFYLTSLVAYIKSRLAGLENRSKGMTLAWYAAALVSAVLAMKTKEIAFTLPVVITLYELLFFEGTIKKRIFLLLPLLLTMMIIPLSLLGTATPLGQMINDVSETTRVQTDMTRGGYLFTEFTVIVTYLRLLFLPYHQNLDYDYPVFHSFLEPQVVFSFLLLALLFGTGIYLLYRERRSPGAGRLIAFGIFWFFITLSVESSVIPIVDVIFEHRLYLPSVGFFLACTSALFLGAARLKARWPQADRAVMGALLSASVVLAGLTFARNIIWQSEVSLWENVIALSPAKARGYNGLGLAYQHLSRHGKAIDCFSRAISLDPEYFNAYMNRGVMYGQTGAFDKALEDLDRAIVINPKFAEAYSNRGIVYALTGQYDKAFDDFTKALALNAVLAEAYYNRGKVYGKTGQREFARADFQKACDLGYENGCNGLHEP